MRVATFITNDTSKMENFDPNLVRKELGETADDLGIVIKAHFLIEKSLRFTCARLAPTFSKFEGNRQRYLLDYLSFLEAFNLSQEVSAPCKRLNELRNAFAHRGNWVLSAEEVGELIAAMPREFRAFHTPKTKVAWFDRSFVWQDGTPGDCLAIACADLSKYIWTLSISGDKKITVQNIWKYQRAE